MITIDQNSRKQLERLAAQRQLYATAKVIFGWQFFLSGPLAVATAFLVVIEPSYKGYVAAWGLIVVLCDLFLLTPWQKRLRFSAAVIQEAFDCDVLGLPWNTLKAGNPPDPEVIKEQSDKYKSWGAGMPTLKNWYPVVVGELPLPVGRIACQRANCWWDSKQRRRYAVSVLVTLILIFVVVIGSSLNGGLTIEDFVLKVAAPLSPAFLLGLRQVSEHIEAAERLDKLKAHAESAWGVALAGMEDENLTALSRTLQDEILENRRKSPLVLDNVFKLLRNDYETQMNYGVDALVKEAKQRISESE